MKSWTQIEMTSGKAVTAALLATLMLPAALAGIQALRIHLGGATRIPPASSFKQVITQARSTVQRLEGSLAAQESSDAWATFLAKPPPPPPEPDPPPPEPEPEKPPPERVTVTVFDLELDGIFFKAGQPYAYVNETPVGLGDIVKGCTVVSINRDTVTFKDEFGSIRAFNIDEELEKRYPGYHRK